MGTNGGRLFAAGIASREWSQFEAAGFENRVGGLVFRADDPPCCGVPLGGLGTGCIDLDARGVLGFVSAFPTRRRHPDTRYQITFREAALGLPFLGLAVDGRTWVCATEDHLAGGRVTGCAEPGMNRELAEETHWVDAWSAQVPAVEGVVPVDEIEYWGHYPVADLEFRSSCPVEVALRAWSPFVPGDAAASNIPAAVFEVHLRNTTDEKRAGTIAISFPGPDPTVSERPYRFRRRVISDSELDGIAVESTDRELGYVLAALDGLAARKGRGLHTETGAWAAIASGLPGETAIGNEAEGDDASGSVAVPFELAAGEETVVRFALAWFARTWQGGSYRDILGFEQWDIGPHEPPGRTGDEGHAYTAMYATRFRDAEDVARTIAREHQDLLDRILGWQGAVYSDERYQPWLQDALINSLSVITEDSYWAAPSAELGEWAAEQGAFGLVESPRGCAIMGCVVSNWYGDLPLTYFFPELEEAIIRNYVALARPDGAVPFLYPNGDWTMPTYEWLLPLNGICFIGLVDRLWLRTKDDRLLDRYFPLVKANTIFTMNLVPPPRGVIGVHRVGTGQEWWEHTPVQGFVTHVAGLRLASLQIAARMATAVGDDDFVRQCDEWFRDGLALAEAELWMDDGESYKFFVDSERGVESDDILSSQLDGEWSSRSHGFDGVFDAGRVERALATIERTCLGEFAVNGFTTRDGAAGTVGTVTFSRDGVPADTPYGTFTAETDIIGMTYMYAGSREVGLDIVRRNADNIIRRQGHGWDLPNMVRSDNGLRNFGTDYFQKLTIWGVPAALAGQAIDGPCRDGGLVNNILRAAQAPSPR